MLKNQPKTKLIIEELDSIIDTAIEKSQQLTLAKEIIFKLLPATAIALLAVYLIIFNRQFGNLPLNLISSAVCIFGLVLYGTFINVNSPYKTVLKFIYGVLILTSGIYLLLTVKEFWVLPDRSYLSFLYIFTVFIVVLADTFYLVDYIYLTPRYAEQTFFRNNRDLVAANLERFREEEVHLACSQVETISEKLFERVSSNIMPGSTLFALIFCGLVSMSAFQIFLENDWFYNLATISYVVILILLSLVLIFWIVKNIRDVRHSDRYDRYSYILTEYAIERIGITEFFRKRKSKIIKEIEKEI